MTQTMRTCASLNMYGPNGLETNSSAADGGRVTCGDIRNKTNTCTYVVTDSNQN